ncbi:acetate--CoA ligase family protein [Parasphingorhabdus pacifica]
MRSAPSTGLDRALLRPRAVAIVGASERSPMAARLTGYLRSSGFVGEVYPVNPNHSYVHGIPCFPSLRDLPGPAELVLVLIPASGVQRVVEEASECGASVLVVLSSGFAETGAPGRRTQTELVERAERHGMRVLGPNCQGLAYSPTGLTATFTAAADLPHGEELGIGYIGQSGALGGSFLGMASDRGIGLTAWFSVGNQADLSVVETAALLIDDPHIRVLACYLEELPDGGEWQALTARAAGLGKHLVVLRSGRSVNGRRAVASHTGALVRAGTAFDLMTVRAGAILVDDLDELLDTSVALTGSPRPRGGRLAVVTSSGGAGSLAADQAEPRGLEVPELDEATRAALRPLVPAFGSVANPVDVTAQLIEDAGHFGTVCRTVAADDHIDAVLVVLTTLGGHTAEEIAASIRNAAATTSKPHVVAWPYSHAEIAPAAARLRRTGIPVVPTTTAALNVLSRLVPQDSNELTPSAPHPPPDGRESIVLRDLIRTGSTEPDGSALLAALDIEHPRGRLVADPNEVDAVARGLGDDVVLKVQSPDVPHKSDVGGVLVGIPASDAGAAADRMLNAVRNAAPLARIDGVLVQERVPEGVELLVGIQGARAGYPPVVTVGMGGVTAELDQDHTSALAPLTPDEAERMLERLRHWPLLEGFRGRPRVDVAAVSRTVAILSQAAAELGADLRELEINPLVAHPGGCVAADLLVRDSRKS